MPLFACMATRNVREITKVSLTATLICVVVSNAALGRGKNATLGKQHRVVSNAILRHSKERRSASW